QPMVEVMTDKASVEIPAPRTGTIATVHVKEGEVVPVGTVIVSIDVDGAEAPVVVAAHENAGVAKAAPPVGAVAATPATRSRVQATPAVRQLAQQLGVALEGIAGSGPGGAVTAEDVRRAVDTSAAPAAQEQTGDQRIPLRG